MRIAERQLRIDGTIGLTCIVAGIELCDRIQSSWIFMPAFVVEEGRCAGDRTDHGGNGW